MVVQSIIKLLRYLLWPVSLLYALVLSIRNLFFDRGIFDSSEYEIPVIAVGNLSVGGTGKTPQIEYLIRLLQKDYTIAVLSRGYKRTSKGFVLADATTAVFDIGDEPFQFYKKFKKIIVAVDSDRRNGIENIMKLEPAVNLILLDDAFQHRKVRANFYTLLTAYENRYTKDFVLPTGDLREARVGAKRANAIIVTKCPDSITDDEKNKIIKEIKPKNYQKVFFSSIKYDTIVSSSSEEIAVNDLNEYVVILVTGIANPKPLMHYLKSKGILFKHIEFADHHSFTEEDILRIHSLFSEIKSSRKVVLTTEKDYTRLSDSIENLYSLGIRTEIQENKSFDLFLKQSLGLI